LTEAHAITLTNGRKSIKTVVFLQPKAILGATQCYKISNQFILL